MNRKRTRGLDDRVAQGSPLSRRGFLLGATATTVSATLAKPVIGAPLDASPGKYTALPTGKKLRLGVVGGNFGLSFPWHLHPNCEVTAVADLLPDRRDKLKERFRCNNVYGEFHPMLKDSKVDAVAFYTEGPDHARHCIDAMRAGKHATTVIPAAVKLEECQELVDTVKSTGRIYMYGETGCFHPAVMAARTFHTEGKFGEIQYTAGDYIHNTYAAPFDVISKALMTNGKRSWRWGFPQGWYSGHATGPIIYATRDRYTEVTAIGTHYRDEPYKDNVYGNPFANTTFFFRTALNKPSVVRVHWLTASPGREGIDIHGSSMSLFEQNEGQPARVLYPHLDDSQFQSKGGQELQLGAFNDALPPELRAVQGHGGSHAQIIHEFVSACIEGRTPAVDVYQAASIAASGIVGFLSAQKGGELMKIPDFGSIA
jgi:predicted dehydrogenase